MKFHAQLTGKLEQIRFSKVKLNFFTEVLQNFQLHHMVLLSRWSELRHHRSLDILTFPFQHSQAICLVSSPKIMTSQIKFLKTLATPQWWNYGLGIRYFWELSLGWCLCVYFLMTEIYNKNNVLIAVHKSGVDCTFLLLCIHRLLLNL